ncbi:MAG: hypothetical protein ACQEXQ_15895 [Bacillota bacterium]
MGSDVVRYFLVAGFSVLLGMISVEFFSKRNFIRSSKQALQWFSYIIFGAFIVLSIYLLFSNISLITDPTQGGKIPINSYSDLLKALVQSEVNLLLISIGAFFGLTGLLSLLIRMPFANWEQVKFFGFEYKRKIDEIKDTAKEAVDEAKTLGIVRLQVLDLIASESMYDILKDFYNGHSINGHSATVEVLNGIELFFEEELGKTLHTGVVPVENGTLNPSYFEQLPSFVREAVHRAFLYPHSLKPMNRKETSVISIPITVGKINNPYFIVYLYSHEYMFTNGDIEMVNISHSILDAHVARLEAESRSESSSGGSGSTALQ